MPKIEIASDRSTYCVRKKTQREIKEYVKQHCAPTITVDVESPEYEEIEVRCRIIRKNPHQYIPYTELSNIIKRQIAPWLFHEKTSFKHVNTSFSVSSLVHAISLHPNVKEVPWCQVIHLSKDIKHPKANKIYHFNYSDSYTDGDIIKPTRGKAILIPAREFKIYQNQSLEENNNFHSDSEAKKKEDPYKGDLSIGYMDIGQSFILSEKIEEEAQMEIGRLKKTSTDDESKKSHFINLKQLIKPE